MLELTLAGIIVISIVCAIVSVLAVLIGLRLRGWFVPKDDAGKGTWSVSP